MNQERHLLSRCQDLILTNEVAKAPAYTFHGSKSQIVFLSIHQHLDHITLSGSHAPGGFCQSGFRIIPQVCPMEPGGQHPFFYRRQHHLPVAVQAKTDSRAAYGGLADLPLQILDAAADAHHTCKPILIVIRCHKGENQRAIFSKVDISMSQLSLGLGQLIPGTLAGIVAFQERLSVLHGGIDASPRLTGDEIYTDEITFAGSDKDIGTIIQI